MKIWCLKCSFMFPVKKCKTGTQQQQKNELDGGNNLPPYRIDHISLGGVSFNNMVEKM